MSVIILDPAEDDLEQIFRWYEEQRTDLGMRFLLEFEKAIERIRLFPKSNEQVYSDFRVAQLN